MSRKDATEAGPLTLPGPLLFLWKLRVLTIERRRSADHLDHIRAQTGCEGVRRVFDVQIGVLAELDLHELVSAEVVVETLAHGVGQSVLPDVNAGGEMVRFAAQRGALLG